MTDNKINIKLLAKQMEAPELYEFLVAHPSVWAGILGDKALAVRMLDQLVRDARHNTRARAHRDMRGDANQEPTGDTVEDAEKRRKGRAKQEARLQKSIFAWAIYSGKTLVDCTAVDLRESVQKRRMLADTNQKAADFEEALADLLPEGVKVSDGLSVELIKNAHDEVYGGEQAVA